MEDNELIVDVYAASMFPIPIHSQFHVCMLILFSWIGFGMILVHHLLHVSKIAPSYFICGNYTNRNIG
jgi:hypothetical protein